jgi:hypothetical protein
VLHLTISDVNRRHLVQSVRLMPLVLEALLLDPGHLRQDQAERTNAGTQADAAERLLQPALYEPGRAMLVKETAATEEANASASGALLAIEGRHAQPTRRDSEAACQQVMISYQWDHQRI